jgi:hypothetical protein
LQNNVFLVVMQSFETVLLPMQLRPIAWINSSTRRVDTPPIHASRITATSAPSLVLLAEEGW